MYLDSFWISAYQLTWNDGYVLVSLSISQTKTVLFKCGLCSVCVTSLANPDSVSIPIVQTNTELCLCHSKLGCTLYICLAVHPPACLLFQLSKNLPENNLHCKSGLIIEHLKQCSLSVLLYLFFRDCMKHAKTVFKLTYAFLMIDYIFSLTFIFRKKCIIYFSYVKLYGKKKASTFKNFPPSLYIPLSLLSEAVLNGNSALSVYACALCWCGVMLHLSMQHGSTWDAF